MAFVACAWFDQLFTGLIIYRIIFVVSNSRPLHSDAEEEPEPPSTIRFEQYERARCRIEISTTRQPWRRTSVTFERESSLTFHFIVTAVDHQWLLHRGRGWGGMGSQRRTRLVSRATGPPPDRSAARGSTTIVVPTTFAAIAPRV